MLGSAAHSLSLLNFPSMQAMLPGARVRTLWENTMTGELYTALTVTKRLAGVCATETTSSMV